MAKQGKTLDEIKAALPEAPVPTPAAPQPAQLRLVPDKTQPPEGLADLALGGAVEEYPEPSFTDLAYQEVTKKS